MRPVLNFFALSVLGFVLMTCSERAKCQAQAIDRSRDPSSGWQTIGSAAPAAAPTAPPLWASSQSGYVPSWNGGSDSWRIGVAIENTDVGVTLTDVERGLPADQAGLVRGDGIVAVGGFQVGYVAGQLYDLGDELQRRVDPQGRVDVVAFDARARRLKATRLQLVRQSTGGVRGEILCRERITLSPQAAVTVRLRDVTYPNWQNVTVGQQVIANPPHPPIAFAIQVDAASIYPDHRYALDAWLEDRGQIVVQTAAPTPIDPRSNAPLQLALVRPSSSGSSGGPYAVAQIDQIAQWYRQYLRREATSQELAAWQTHLQAGRSPQEILAYLLASSEYYDRLGNQRDRFLSELFTVVNGRAPNSTELQQMISRYLQYGGQRSLFVRDAVRLMPDGT